MQPKRIIEIYGYLSAYCNAIYTHTHKKQMLAGGVVRVAKKGWKRVSFKSLVGAVQLSAYRKCPGSHLPVQVHLINFTNYSGSGGALLFTSCVWYSNK